MSSPEWVFHDLLDDGEAEPVPWRGGDIGLGQTIAVLRQAAAVILDRDDDIVPLATALRVMWPGATSPSRA